MAFEESKNPEKTTEDAASPEPMGIDYLTPVRPNKEEKSKDSLIQFNKRSESHSATVKRPSAVTAKAIESLEKESKNKTRRNTMFQSPPGMHQFALFNRKTNSPSSNKESSKFRKQSNDIPDQDSKNIEELEE